MRNLLIAAAAVALTATPSLAQVNTSGGLVNVSVQNVDILKNFLNNDQIAALNGIQVPVTVAVPIGVAANVCGVSAAVIGKSTSDPVCTARNGSKALANSFAAQKLGGQKK
jgi:branched-subunit amino acid ABC-type transport system permease component